MAQAAKCPFCDEELYNGDEGNMIRCLICKVEFCTKCAICCICPKDLSQLTPDQQTYLKKLAHRSTLRQKITFNLAILITIIFCVGIIIGETWAKNTTNLIFFFGIPPIYVMIDFIVTRIKTLYIIRQPKIQRAEVRII